MTTELSQRVITATPFAGNVPGIDFLAFANNVTAHIKVKAINMESWQFDVRKFLEMKHSERGQKVLSLTLYSLISVHPASCRTAYFLDVKRQLSACGLLIVICALMTV